jgi:hypothetical protein
LESLEKRGLRSEPGFLPERCLRISHMKERDDADDGTER